MNGLNATGLMKLWEAAVRVADISSSDSPDLHCCTLSQPWQRLKTPSAQTAVGLDFVSPDFGIRFAKGFVTARRQGLISRRSGRGMLGQVKLRGDLMWIRHAIRYLERLEVDRRPVAGQGSRSPPQLAVAEAISIAHNPRQLALLRRLLISQGAEPDKVAAAMELNAATVAAYRALFFNVGDRDREPFRFFAALMLTDEENLEQSNDPDGVDENAGLQPLAEFACFGFGMAVVHCGLGFEGSGSPVEWSSEADGEADGEADRMVFLRAWRTLLLHPNACLPSAKVVSEAIAKYTKVNGELRARRSNSAFSMSTALNEALDQQLVPALDEPELDEPEPIEPKLSAPFVHLTREDLCWMAELWHRCEPTGPALATPLPACTLQPPWRRAEEPELGGVDFPDELWRPDFGSLLAKRVAAAGRSEELPTGGPFHWIHLMAAGLESALVGGRSGVDDADATVLRQAAELDARAASRQLLQAALVTRDAEIGEVAAPLGLDVRVVVAYAVLYFHLRACRRGSYNPDIQRRIEACNQNSRNGGIIPDSGLEAVVAAAPRITLDDLWHLLGFRVVNYHPVDAANRLLKLLLRVTRGGQVQSGGIKKARNSSGIHPGKAQVETAVRRATEKINVYDLDPSSLDNPAFTSSMLLGLAKAKKRSKYETYILMLMDSGSLTKEEAELRWEQTKRKNTTP